MDITPWQIAFILFPAIAILHLHVSPFTKVEESFNIQAIHDILQYGIPTENTAEKFRFLFDHMTFPGAVPRTFIGSLVVSGLALPEIWFGDLVGRESQTHVRAVLGGMNATALAIFARSVSKAYGHTTALWYVALQASQFHLWYYASRTLPNMFAFFLSTVALACLIPNPTSMLGPVKRTRLGLYLLTVATVIFRSELAILLAAHCAWMFLKPETFESKVLLVRKTFIPAILPGAVLSILLTVLIDTYIWQSPTYLWPELSAFLSNVFPSKDGLGASAWGTQPFYWYLTAALPRLLMNQYLMVDFFFAYPQTLLDSRFRDHLVPSYAYVMVYSILPHKETRFMFPIVPSLTLVAAMTCTRLTINMDKNVLTKFLFYLAVISTIITAFVSHAILLPFSALNYPGGHALEALHEYYQDQYQTITPLHNTNPSHPELHVHLTNLALQSGITRFLEQPTPLNITYEPPSITLSQPSTNENNQPHFDPIILPGDANHPALTIYPKPPQSSSNPSLPDKRSFQNPTWIYDKTSNATTFLSHTFWSTFDFAIVEDPTQVLGSTWRIIDEVQALSSPTLLRPGQNTERRYTLSWRTPDEIWTYWTTSDIDYSHGSDVEDDTSTGTAALLMNMYPSAVAIPLIRLHDLAHDILRLGSWPLPFSVTRGYWIEVPLTTKLYILRNMGVDSEDQSEHEGVHDHAQNHERKEFEIPRFEREDASEADPGPESKIDTEQKSFLVESQPSNPETLPASWDEIGPLVVNKDGTLSRLDNWKEMNGQERKRTVEYLRKRNLIRLEGEEGRVEEVM